MTLRAATPNDIDALTAVHVSAMPMDPNFPYLFPNVSDYYDDYVEFIKNSIRFGMTRANDERLLIEASDPSKPSEKCVVAWATWVFPESYLATEQVPASTHDSESEDKPPDRVWRYLPKTRWDAYIPAATQAREKFLSERYGKRHLFLGEMVVHPDFQRRGYGKILMQWGIEKAKQQRWAITAFASAPGRRLYESFGMREIGSFRTQVEGEDEYIDNPILAMDAPES